jgi:uncharacterized protein YggL (DUF469 family)
MRNNLDKKISDTSETPIDSNKKNLEVDVVVELGHRSGDPDKKRMKITAWLDGREDVQSWRIGPEFDVWHSERQRWLGTK